jgi:CRP-like cAMP-binding protein
MLSPLARKLAHFVQLDVAEQQCIAALQTHEIQVPRGSELIRQGEHGRYACFLQSGWGCSSKILLDGARQVITFPIPGDCIGMRSVLLRKSDHTFTALTDVLLTRVDADRILPIFNQFPRVGAALLWAASRDEAITVDHLASVRRRSAIERTAHFFLELHERLFMVGLAGPTEFCCPLTQYDLADALGLSAIHVNRVLRELREVNLLEFQRGKVTFWDMRALRDLAGYEAIDEQTPLVKLAKPASKSAKAIFASSRGF